MKNHLVMLAGLLGAILPDTVAVGAPPSSSCKAPELARRDLKGVKVGNWQALAARIGTDGAVADEADAIQSVCAYWDCDASSRAVCAVDEGTACFVKDGSGTWFAFPNILQDEDSLEVTREASPDGRWLHVGIKSELIERIEDARCDEDDDGEVECQSASETFN